MANEIAKKENTELTYNEGIDLASVFAEEMDGLTPTFERIKIPSGGGISFEVPGDDPENPDTVKEFKAVILYHHPLTATTKKRYTDGNNPPDCGSWTVTSGSTAESGEVRTAPNVRSTSSAVARTAQRLASRNAASISCVKGRLCPRCSRCLRVRSRHSRATS